MASIILVTKDMQRRTYKSRNYFYKKVIILYDQRISGSCTRDQVYITTITDDDNLRYE